jgi:hypothetical protein
MSQITTAHGITFADRLDHGYVTIAELCALKQCGQTQVYADIKAGALKVEKHGRSNRIFGPTAKAYIPGQRRLANRQAA